MNPFIHGGKNREKAINAHAGILSGVYGLSKGYKRCQNQKKKF